MDKQTQDLSDALSSYRAYRRLDPSERRIGEFINIIDSIFPPLSSSHNFDDILLARLLMIHPNLLADSDGPNPGGQQTSFATQERPQRLAAPTQSYSSAAAVHPGIPHAVPNTAHVPMTKQHK